MKNKGILFALGAYLSWGVLPVYWKALQSVPATQILGHRISWSFVLLFAIILARREWSNFRGAIASRHTILFSALAAGLLGVNWLVYIWAVNSAHIVETSLGYFINPLVSVVLGVVFFKERLRPVQWTAVGLATVGVIYLTVRFGALPWIALVLALSFGFYGLLKKKSALEALYGLSLEMSFLFLPALAYLFFIQSQGSGAFGYAGATTNILLVLTGAVTALPVLMFGFAARSIPLTLVGLLQYIAPTCQFLLGVMAYGEPFTSDQLVGFSIIWLALIIYWLEGVLVHRRSALPKPVS